MIPRFKPWLGMAELAALFRPHRGAVEHFEREFADAFDAVDAIAFPYGRSALWAFLKAVGVTDAEVIVPAYTCSVVAHAVALSGNRPVFVDIDPSDYNMNLDLFRDAITADTRAVVATHLFGYPLELDRVETLVADAEARYGHKIWLIQDCAHSFGASWHGRPVGSSGDVALYAFNISKTMTAIFGGMLTFRDSELADTVRAWRDREFRQPGVFKSLLRRAYLFAAYCAFLEPVYTVTHWLQHRTPLLSRLTKSYHLDDAVHFPPDHLDRMLDVEAAVGRVQLRKYPENIAQRRENAAWYDRNLAPGLGITLPPIVEGATYSHFVVRVPSREEAMAFFAARGVEVGQLIEYSVPELPAYRGGRDCPQAGAASETTINLPVGPHASGRLQRVADAFTAYCRTDTEYFTQHWQEVGDAAYPVTKQRAARAFLEPLRAADLAPGAPVLDAGCGDGVHASVIDDVVGAPVAYHGVDISEPALETGRARNPAAKFSYADVLSLPFADDAFDATFGYGVLAYTASPAAAFAELCRVTRPGGLIGAWFYTKPAAPLWLMLSAARFVGGIAPRFVANLVVPFLPLLPTSSRISLFNASWAQCREIVLVNLAPRRLWYPRTDEVVRLLADNDIEVVSVDDTAGITVWGKKR